MPGFPVSKVESAMSVWIRARPVVQNVRQVGRPAEGMKNLNDRARSHALVGLAFVLLAGAGCAASPPMRIALDGDTRYQTIDGWATVTRYWEEDKANDRFDRSFEPHQEAIAGFLANDVGINAVRLELLSGMENPNDYWTQFYTGAIGYRDTPDIATKKSTTTATQTSKIPPASSLRCSTTGSKSAVVATQACARRRGVALVHQHLLRGLQVDSGRRRTVQGPSAMRAIQKEFPSSSLVYLRRLKNKDDLSPIASSSCSSRRTQRSGGRAR